MNNDIKNNNLARVLIIALVFASGIALGFFVGKITNQNISNDNIVDDTALATTEYVEKNINVTIESEESVYDKALSEYKTYLSSTKVGDVFSFGKYEQDNDIYNGKEDIEWIVLYKSNKNSMLLISKYILDCMPYNFSKKEVLWQDSDIRKYLNDDFYKEAFDINNQLFIMENEMTNSANVNYKTDAGNETIDRVFLLSESQAKRYFQKSDKKNHNQNRGCAPTEYAKEKGVVPVVDKNEWYDGNASYWLRTPGVDKSRAELIEPTGEIFEYGELVSSIEVGIRPCIWLKY